MLFALLFLSSASAVFAAPVHLVDEGPVEIKTVSPGVYLVDFGRVAFGNLRLMPPAGAKQDITVHFGEAFSQGRINRKPPGTVRYAMSTLSIEGNKAVVAAPKVDARNTKQPAAVLTPRSGAWSFPSAGWKSRAGRAS